MINQFFSVEFENTQTSCTLCSDTYQPVDSKLKQKSFFWVQLLLIYIVSNKLSEKLKSFARKKKKF